MKALSLKPSDKRFSVIITSSIIFLLGASLSTTLLGQSNELNAKVALYNIFRSAIAESLISSIKGTKDLDENGVIRAVIDAISTKSENIRSDKWVFDHGNILKEVKDELIKKVGTAKPLTLSGFDSSEVAVNSYLVELLGETTTGPETNPLSDYRFLMGGSWVHTDSSEAVGKFTASLLVRTRWYDKRGKIPEDDVHRNETWFLDLLVDAQFITNESFNEIKLSDPTNRDSVKSVILNSVQSSKLSMALVFCIV